MWWSVGWMKPRRLLPVTTSWSRWVIQTLGFMLFWTIYSGAAPLNFYVGIQQEVIQLISQLVQIKMIVYKLLKFRVVVCVCHLPVPCPGPVVSPQEERPSCRHQDAQQVHQVWSQVSLCLLHAHQDRQQTAGRDRGRVSRPALIWCSSGSTQINDLLSFVVSLTRA